MEFFFLGCFYFQGVQRPRYKASKEKFQSLIVCEKGLRASRNSLPISIIMGHPGRKGLFLDRKKQKNTCGELVPQLWADADSHTTNTILNFFPLHEAFGKHWSLFSVPIILHFPEYNWNRIIWYVFFYVCFFFFSFRIALLLYVDSSILSLSVPCSFLLLSCSLVYIYMPFFLYPCTNWLTSELTFWQSWIKLLLAFTCRLSVGVCFHLSWVNTKEWDFYVIWLSTCLTW